MKSLTMLLCLLGILASAEAIDVRKPNIILIMADEDLSPVFREQRNAKPAQRWAWGLWPQEITLPHLLTKAGYRTALVDKWHLGYDEKLHPLNYGFEAFRGFIVGNVVYHKHVAGYSLKQPKLTITFR